MVAPLSLSPRTYVAQQQQQQQQQQGGQGGWGGVGSAGASAGVGATTPAGVIYVQPSVGYFATPPSSFSPHSPHAHAHSPHANIMYPPLQQSASTSAPYTPYTSVPDASGAAFVAPADPAALATIPVDNNGGGGGDGGGNPTSPAERVETAILMPDAAAMRQDRAARELGQYSDFQMRIIAIVTVLINLFKICMASMLSVFVPQACPNKFVNSTNSTVPSTVVTDSNGTATGSHECSFNENFEDLTTLNKAALAFNFIVLGFMLAQYYFVWKRERFAINKLDVDVTQLRISLPTNLANYPEDMRRLRFYNRITFALSAVGATFQMVNILTSGVLVFRDYWLSYRTATSFFSSILLVLDSMYNDTTTTYKSMMFDVCFSCLQLEPISYNVVDASRRKRASTVASQPDHND